VSSPPSPSPAQQQADALAKHALSVICRSFMGERRVGGCPESGVAMLLRSRQAGPARSRCADQAQRADHWTTGNGLGFRLHRFCLPFPFQAIESTTLPRTRPCSTCSRVRAACPRGARWSMTTWSCPTSTKRAMRPSSSASGARQFHKEPKMWRRLTAIRWVARESARRGRIELLDKIQPVVVVPLLGDLSLRSHAKEPHHPELNMSTGCWDGVARG
jgi:hypothetical protein